MTETTRHGPEHPAGEAPWARLDIGTVLEVLREYAVVVLLAAVFIWLTFASPAFLTTGNLLNILNQNAPLAIVAAAGTLVIISGGFDLSTGAIFGVAAVVAAWLAVNVDPMLGLASAPLVGASLGLLNGAIITAFRVHSFLATLATGLVYRGAALLITGGFLIPVGHIEGFTALGRGRIGDVNIAVVVLAAWAVFLWIVLNRSQLGRPGRRTPATTSGASGSTWRSASPSRGRSATCPPSTTRAKASLALRICPEERLPSRCTSGRTTASPGPTSASTTGSMRRAATRARARGSHTSTIRPRSTIRPSCAPR
jgi:hypothetical protein